MLRGRPVADVRALIEELYQTTFPMDFASVLANPVEYHPLATDAATGESTDLRPFVGNPAELRPALRASAALAARTCWSVAIPDPTRPCRCWPRRLESRRPPVLPTRGVSESVPYRHGAGPGRHAPAGAAFPP